MSKIVLAFVCFWLLLTGSVRDLVVFGGYNIILSVL